MEQVPVVAVVVHGMPRVDDKHIDLDKKNNFKGMQLN